MTSERKVAANRANSLRSSGPTSAAGKSRSAGNALATGLYSRLAVVEILGESLTEWEAFADAVDRDLGTHGAVEMALAQQVAALLWRLRRLRLAEGAAFRADPADPLPPHPDSVTGEGVDWRQAIPPGAPAARRLAYERFEIGVYRKAARRKEGAARVVSGAGERLGDVGPDWMGAGDTNRALVAVLGLGERDEPLFAQIPGWQKDPRLRCTGELLRTAVAAAARSAGRDPDAVAVETADRLREGARADYAEADRREAATRDLVEEARMDRARAVAAAALAEGSLLERVAKIEAQIVRELERVLGLLDRLRAARGAGAGAERVGFVPPKRVGPAHGEARVIPLREAAE